MVYLITGKINSGKTTKMLDLYRQLNKGDGFISVKTMKENDVYKYDLMRLSTAESKVLAYKAPHFQMQFHSSVNLGDYYFNDSSFLWAEEEIDKMINNHIAPVFLDEIGLLEIQGQGFCKTIKKLLEASHLCYFTVRDVFIERFIEKYEITEYEIIAE